MVNSPLEKKELLVTGASGFLGWNLCERALAEWSVNGVSFSNSCMIKGVNMFRAELGEEREICRVLDARQFSVVLHAAALSPPAWCETHEMESLRVNVEATRVLARQCMKRGIRLIFTSSDLVFAGSKAPYKPDSVTAQLREINRIMTSATRGDT